MIYWLCSITMMLVLLGTYFSAEKVQKTQIRAGGAKVVSVNPDRGSDGESKSLLERVRGWATAKSEPAPERSGNRLADLRARQRTMESATDNFDFQDMISTYEKARKAAIAAGVTPNSNLYTRYHRYKNEEIMKNQQLK